MDQTKFLCVYCSEQFSSKRTLNYHIKFSRYCKNIEKNPPSFICRYRTHDFTTKRNLKLHEPRCPEKTEEKEQQLKEKVEEKVEQKEEKFLCTFCLKDFKHSTTLKNHRCDKNKEIDFEYIKKKQAIVCMDCKRGFYNQSIYNKHISQCPARVARILEERSKFEAESTRSKIIDLVDQKLHKMKMELEIGLALEFHKEIEELKLELEIDKIKEQTNLKLDMEIDKIKDKDDFKLELEIDKIKNY